MLSRIKAALAALGVFLLALGVAFLRGRAEGKKILEAEQHQARDQLQEAYDEIDARPRDPDRAYDALRGLSDDKGGR